VTGAALTGVAFAIPQQVMAGGHGHGHKHNSNGIKVDQQINQANYCKSTSPSDNTKPMGTDNSNSNSGNGDNVPGTICVNLGSNSAHIGH
jgi:hypothetical protein